MKKYYKSYPEAKPKAQRHKLNIYTLLEKHGKDKMLDLISKHDDDRYAVNMASGKIVKKRMHKSKEPVIEEPVKKPA